jgi:hypothetical protein
MMEFNETDIGTEVELDYEEEGVMASIKSTDGHKYRVERDVNKTDVNILFNDENEDPPDHNTDRPVSKAMKRALQKQLVKEELIEFADSQGESAQHRFASTPIASISKTVTLAPTSPRAVSTSTAASKAVAPTAPVKAATIASTTAIKPTATVTPVGTEDVTTLVRGRSEVEEPDRGSKAPIDSPDKTDPENSTTCNETWPVSNSAVFKTVKKGGDDKPELDDVTTRVIHTDLAVGVQVLLMLALSAKTIQPTKK